MEYQKDYNGMSMELGRRKIMMKKDKNRSIIYNKSSLPKLNDYLKCDREDEK